MPRRLRRARAELKIELECKAPPDFSSGGVVFVRVLLVPGESFTIKKGWLDLSLITTRFSRTVLDGYLEHSTGKLFHKVELCGQTEGFPSKEIVLCAAVPMPQGVPPEAGPVRLRWKLQARFDVKGHRAIRAATSLSPSGPAGDQGPVVDGRGFLPL